MNLSEVQKALWAAADKLRANMDAAEYKHIVLGLIFLKYVSDTFSARRAELTRRFADENDDYFLHDCDDELLAEELEDRDYYKEVNVFWVPEAARWETLRAAAKQPDIGKRIDDALALIEQENAKLEGILDKRYARAQLPDGKVYDPCCGSGGMFVQSEKFIETHRGTASHCAESVVLREMGSGAKFRDGDTLLARITPCHENGKSALVDFLRDDAIGWGSTEFVVLRPKPPLPEFHAYLRDTLLPRLISGQLRPPQTQGELDEALA